MKQAVSFTLNGVEATVLVSGSEPLLGVLRGALDQPGTKEGCGRGECGACTVLVDGRAVNACLFRAAEAEGRSVTTIEGLSGPGNALSPVQKAFVDGGGIQCGFCSPGMILASHALLTERPDPSDDEVRDALLGNLCRCTGYVQIIESVQAAAAAMREEGS